MLVVILGAYLGIDHVKFFGPVEVSLPKLTNNEQTQVWRVRESHDSVQLQATKDTEAPGCQRNHHPQIAYTGLPGGAAASS